jgi:TPR repeat protein
MAIPSKDCTEIIAEAKKYLKTDKTKAHSLLLEAAKLEAPRAMRMLAYQFEVGDGVSKDLNKARLWYSKAKEAGDHYAETKGLPRVSAFLNAKALLKKKKEKEAHPLLLQAAALGLTEAMRIVAHQFEKGDGIQTNKSQALIWYKLAAKNGDEYATNRGLPRVEAYIKAAEYLCDKQEPKKAQECYEKAVELGCDDAKREVGFFYLQGCCQFEIDKEKGFLYIQQLIDKGDVDAMFEMADLYARGCPRSNIERDLERAADLYEKVVLKGERTARDRPAKEKLKEVQEELVDIYTKAISEGDISVRAKLWDLKRKLNYAISGSEYRLMASKSNAQQGPSSKQDAQTPTPP